MSLWADKHRPRDFKKLDFHLNQGSNLKNLVQEGDFPHLLVYGPSGSGKKTRIMCILKELFGSGVERLRMEHMNFTTPSNKKFEIMTVSSNYHIEINPSDAGIYDRIVVMELIKNVAQNQQIDVGGQRSFKVVVLTDIDDLTRDAQHALRRTMEKYITNCRLILIANSTSRVTPAIKSRCLAIRVPAPTKDEVISVLMKTCKKESLLLPMELAEKIAEKSGRNLRRALLMCEACRVEKYPFDPDQNVSEPDWYIFIVQMAKRITQEQTIACISEVRNNLYELITHAIPSAIILRTLLEELLKNCDMALKTQIVELAAFYEHQMKHGNKDIFHFEAFVCKVMYIYKKFMDDLQNAIGDDF